MKENKEIFKISVRNLVEFILRSGDLDNRVGRKSSDAMQEGSKIHRKIQKQMGDGYQVEVSLALTVPFSFPDFLLDFCVEGRADGVFKTEIEGETLVCIDEIKGVYRNLSYITEPATLHLAQALCYAYIYAVHFRQEKMAVQLTYCHLETEEIKRFQQVYTFEDLKKRFAAFVESYLKWVIWKRNWKKERNETIKRLTFPFSYRTGQKELVRDVYLTILRERKLFIEAPTGVGKTISTIFPAIKAMGEEKIEKIFYLTAKTITRTVAEETFLLLKEQGLLFKMVTLTAKEKICVLEKQDCNPLACERAKGHFDRVNDAVFDLLLHEMGMDRTLIETYAKKHNVCPFEMCLDVTNWADGVICDYNYVFDPNVSLKRFFAKEKRQDFVFLIDEAHNLLERAREMYSAVLYKQDFLTVKNKMIATSTVASKYAKAVIHQLEACNKYLLSLKRSCDDCEVWEDIQPLLYPLMCFISSTEEYMLEQGIAEGREELLNLYFRVRHFINMYEGIDEKYIIYSNYEEQGEFRLKLLCMDPSGKLKECLEKGRTTIFFSATLLPIQYYKEQLGGVPSDYAIYVPSPFDTSKRLLLVADDVSTAYKRRTLSEYSKIISYIKCFTSAKKGNYLVFFPSYQMMQEIYRQIEEKEPLYQEQIILQGSKMTEPQKEEFLTSFQELPQQTRIGFCVMGGIFSEGIDLKQDRLIGAVIVGTGLPMVCQERELFREFFDEKNGKGFDYAYLYAGMNKVLQAAGRVIRTAADCGSILLLDERFFQQQYRDLFPYEWYPFLKISMHHLEQELKAFWERV